MICRLQDPKNLVSFNELEKLRTKLDSSLIRLIKATADGGNPFLYSLIATKTHELADELSGLPGWQTAATDGDKYFWHPIFLEKLEAHEIQIVLQHESIHALHGHVTRFAGKDPMLWAICIDYCTNAHIENDYRKSKRLSSSKYKHFIWGGNLGNPISIENFILVLEGKKIFPKYRSCFADITALNDSPESLYNKLKPYWNNNQKKSDFSKITIDGHLPILKSKQDILEELMRASERANKIEKDSVPAYADDIIKKLINPSLNLKDHILMACLHEVQNNGVSNNWKRPRRRSFATNQYMPSRKTHKPKWLAMLDTSGSMSRDDLTYGLSQLQSLGADTDGLVVPCDAEVHWNKATKINDIFDLQNTVITGGGGTSFDNFFTDYVDNVGSEFDIIIIITDGFVAPPKEELCPIINVFWIVTNEKQFRPNFGKVLALNHLKK